MYSIEFQQCFVKKLDKNLKEKMFKNGVGLV